MILVIHTFGEYLGWHPHLHILCADGLFRQSGLFYCMRPVDLQELELLFRDRVLNFLVQAGKIAQATADQISAWPHSGWSITAALSPKTSCDRTGRAVHAAQSFALSKMTYNEHSATVIYRSLTTIANATLRSFQPRRSSRRSPNISPHMAFKMCVITAGIRTRPGANAVSKGWQPPQKIHQMPALM